MKSKKVIIVIICLILVAGAGFATYYFLNQKATKDAAASHVELRSSETKLELVAMSRQLQAELSAPYPERLDKSTQRIIGKSNIGIRYTKISDTSYCLSADSKHLLINSGVIAESLTTDAVEDGNCK